ncbi:sigma-70 family RNA polymerase sigma factor [Liquorilactobacillus satsumensis]|uniref:ComX n=1 Tax=Liquorilactobacillus satsumensis DSM 16230 = JCM 12392 TaxID=1423801 RepID=A0A0R1V9W8_9LACO|nr:sigma-70 family RNA polymerase sigma factor [Liquorilactobacillus satsumensis]KRM00089.1 ComX [Liquorilactobacillus satsumensis DSM 16230 = JCM 12392]MCC7667983.1 sigma-70 family RNA polymerase sigma factor [Liquorilactobacillus satsumensis]MCP9313271.1 sigma-70 family RNA polymerase sigma factor [Liquorilactobacillus satsumensis]MCP9329609.1 sigma-70 family RNA polymerase sigma factor [Liquorilactobacillus satsumensis]MCP9358111.1 sigma-70 family RNA polymerase sigma factor [Liquorilactoba
MNYNNIKTEDFSLITKIRQSNDSEAFRLLFIKYRPLVINAMQRYHFRFHETDDLLQEARIVCFQAVQAYNQSTSISFGKFYQQSLLNRYCSLLRKETAVKRQGERFAESFENLLETQGDCYSYSITQVQPEDLAIIQEVIDSLPHILSDFEYHVFSLLYFEHFHPDKISSFLAVPESRIKRAISRCKAKLKEALQQ